MHLVHASSASNVHRLSTRPVPARVDGGGATALVQPADGTAEMLRLIADRLPIRRTLVHAGDTVCGAGRHFENLYVINSGAVKVVNIGADGQEQLVGLQFRGDWLGLDGIAPGSYCCDTVALDTGEVWALHYGALLLACAAHPRLLARLHMEMSREITRGRDAMLSLCTLSAPARVAAFVRQWAESLTGLGRPLEEITLRVTRAEIGSHLGMTLESVSRALSFLARSGMIDFAGAGRRVILIRDLAALTGFIRANALAPRSAVR
jgi:CRP/FNR family transcriptional regulator, anaerobic regulatory protein